MNQYEENIEHDNLRRPDWLLFVRAFKKSFLRVKLWGATWLVLLILSLVPALMTGGAVGRMVGNRYPTADASRDLDWSLRGPTVMMTEVFRQDHREALGSLDTAVSHGMAALALFAVLFGIFAAGGWLQVIFEQPDRQTLRRFGFGGARYFGRFLRVAILTLLMLALVRWIYYGDPWKRIVYGWIMDVPQRDWGRLETLPSERQVVYLTWLRDGLAALAFAKVLAWAIYTRTRIVLREGRSAVASGIATMFTMARHPIQTMRPLFFLLLVEVLVIVLFLGWWQGTVEERLRADANGWHVAAMFGIVQLAVIWRMITRGAYYHAAGRVSQSLILPTESRPDPWAEAVGGPGGPRYPVVEDDYHVTI